MNKILVPTDFSNCANNAVEIGLQIAQKTGASIDFMHLLPTIVDWVKLSVEEEKKYPEIKRKVGHAHSELNSLVEKAAKQGVKSEKNLAFTQNENALLEHALNCNCDLIVMGSHGASGLKELVFGSNTQYVVRNAMPPVLVIKEAIEDFEPTQILFASTFEEDIYYAFPKILAFAKMMNAKIRLLYVNNESHFEETRISNKRMEFFMKHFQLDNCDTNVYNAKNIEKGILHFAEDNQIDLISLVTRGRTGFKRLFKDSLTEKLVNHSNFPVLSVNVKS